MYYIDLNDKQKSYIYSKCSVKHIKDVGPRSIMYKRLNSNAFFINTFVTNFNEKFLYLSLESSGGASGKLVINPESEKYFL